jgi:hypothetical protein
MKPTERRLIRNVSRHGVTHPDRHAWSLRRQPATGGFSHKPISQNQTSAVRTPASIGTSSGSLHHRIAATHRTQKMMANMRIDIAVAPASELRGQFTGDTRLLTAYD